MTRAEAVEIREASSVILKRDGPNGPETWMMRRQSSVDFAAGMSVFPGGRVDAADAETARMINLVCLEGLALQLSAPQSMPEFW